MVRDAIPWVRWTLAPWRTCLLWRRMVLLQITSYRQALDAELELRRAVGLLRARYGLRWRRRAPADVVWMLRAGVHADEACARVFAAVPVDDLSPLGRPVPAVSEVAAANPNTIAYLETLGEVDVTSFQRSVPALLWSSAEHSASPTGACGRRRRVRRIRPVSRT
jgi:hypothetical protein